MGNAESKLRLFLENFIVYGLGGVVRNVVPLVMLPIVTRMLPGTTYYGLSDLSNTLLQIGSALAVMGMYDALFRMFFEKNDREYKISMCSTAMIFTTISSIILSILLLAFGKAIAQFFFGGREYINLVYITAATVLVSSTNNIIAAPTRMKNDRKTYLIINIMTPVISYSITILLIMSKCYLMALPIGALVSGMIMEGAFLLINKEWFNFKTFNVDYLKDLLRIAIPLLPNFIIYWIFNSSDRLMITNLIGLSAAGIYAVASKLGHCSQLIYTAFAGGWQFFAFSTMHEEDQVKSNSAIFEYLAVISFVFTMIVCVASRWIFSVLFSSDYYQGYLAAPYLFFAPLTQMLFQVACNQFLVVKKTWPNLIILAFGALMNIILNVVLIPAIGIEGAAIATLVGYVVSVIVCTSVLVKMRLMIVSNRLYIASITMLTFLCLWRFAFHRFIVIGILAVTVCIGVYTIAYHKEIKFLLHKIRRR